MDVDFHGIPFGVDGCVFTLTEGWKRLVVDTVVAKPVGVVTCLWGLAVVKTSCMVVSSLGLGVTCLTCVVRCMVSVVVVSSVVGRTLFYGVTVIDANLVLRSDFVLSISVNVDMMMSCDANSPSCRNDWPVEDLSIACTWACMLDLS